MIYSVECSKCDWSDEIDQITCDLYSRIGCPECRAQIHKIGKVKDESDIQWGRETAQDNSV
jgi:hypothetical protein